MVLTILEFLQRFLDKDLLLLYQNSLNQLTKYEITAQSSDLFFRRLRQRTKRIRLIA